MARPALTQDLKELLELLIENKVPYLIIGGQAMAVHHCPRYTKDLDLWIDNNEKDSVNLYKTLCQFGFQFDESFITLWQIKPKIIILGNEPNRVDLLNGTKGVTFAECYKDKVSYSYDNLILNCISKKHLILNKQAVGRSRDIVDVETLLNS